MIDVTYEEFLKAQEIVSTFVSAEFITLITVGCVFITSYCIFGLIEIRAIRKKRKLVEEYIHEMESKLHLLD